MKIEKNKLVKIHYILKDAQGNELDSSFGREPLEYIHGSGMIISGLENALEGKEAGIKFKTVIEAEDAYGEYNKNLVVEIPREQFDTENSIEIGMPFQAGTPNGDSLIVHVVNITDDFITVDANHEFAGKQLTFDVEIIDVRNADEQFYNESKCCSDGCSGCSGKCGCF